MPRLSDSDYLRNAPALHREWTVRSGYAFTILSPTEQILIHEFYEPSNSFTDRQLRSHRVMITKRQQPLPHQAGNAFARIEPFLDVVLAPPPAPARDEPYVAKITSGVNPQIDPARMAQILIAIVRENHDRAA